MGVEEVRNFTSTWTTTTTTMAAPKLCDSCKSSTAALFCRADSAFLCLPCDSKVHAANKLASRHARVWMCEVCEQAPAHVTCKADAAALCVTCDGDIHSANPLARRHERFPVTPFYDSATAANHHQHHHQQQYFDDVSKGGNVNETEAEAEAASWLIPNPNSNYGNVYSEMDMDPYLDLVYGSTVDTTKVEGHKSELNQPYKYNNNKSSAADCVVPVQNNNFRDSPVNGGEGGLDSCFDVDLVESKAFHFYNNGQSVGQSVSSSSLDAGVVPDGSTMIDVSNPFGRQYSNVSDATNQKVQVSGIDREARVLRYREKRKNRKFEKTIRYASRKAYAETRPRIKGRFAKRSEIEFDVDQIFGTSPGLIAADTGYGVVPTF